MYCAEERPRKCNIVLNYIVITVLVYHMEKKFASMVMIIYSGFKLFLFHQ